MELWVLGTLEVTHSGRSAAVRGPLPRRLLALLALSPGREVSTDQLVDGLWGQAPPPGASATLQSHVARLRRDLPVHDAVRTGRHGYLLDVSMDDVDAYSMERDLALGSRALVEGRTDEASRVLTEALKSWRGTPYAEFVDCPVLEAEADRLGAVRLDALERRITADLSRPGGAAPVAELEALVRWHPMHEAFWALLMMALYRSGRQADALAAYQRARSTLAEELGIDPGPALRELERMILTQDGSLDGPSLSSLLPTRLVQPTYPDAVALVERADLLQSLVDLQDQALAGAGRVALVHGEAGAGKSALVRAWCGQAAQAGAVLHGACDPLSSPRPLGPLVDVAPHLDAQVGEMLAGGERDGLFEATLDALAALAPVVLVVEDLHWADESTLDLVRFLARRVDRAGIVLVLTYRDDQLAPADPLRVMLGDIAGSPTVRRLPVPPLTAAGVAELARDSGLDPQALFAETGGNAFFVTEVLASGGEQLPATVQDAVLARVHRLAPQARLALESAAAIGSRAEPALLQTMPDVTADGVDACVTAGMLQLEAPLYAFRHELVRQAVLSAVPPSRLGALHWQVLDRLRAMRRSPELYARLAEHAEMAGDGPATLEFALAAGDHAASLGSHREAASQYGRAMAHLDLLEPQAQIELLHKRASECFLTDEQREAIDAWQVLVERLRTQDRPRELADVLIRYARSLTNVGEDSRAPALVEEAITLLQDLPPTPELAVAQALYGHINVDPADLRLGEEWCRRAVDLARQVGDPHVLSYTLNSWGTSLLPLGQDAVTPLRESIRIALDNDLEDDAARGYSNLAWVLRNQRDFPRTLDVLEDGMRYATDHDLNGNYLCLLASSGTVRFLTGDWDASAQIAHELLDVRGTQRASRMDPLLVLGLLAARRGDVSAAWPFLEEARECVAEAYVLGYDGDIAMAYGEVTLLVGDVAALEAAVQPVYAEAVRQNHPEYMARLGLMLWRAGLLDELPPAALEAARLSVEGRPREAAELWRREGLVYEAAWALLDSTDEVDLREARGLFDQMGLPPLVARCDERLRAIGAKVPRGMRPSTRANVGNLTDRETEVLALLEEGLRNSEIAARLCLSEKTVGNHVSAILAKFGVASRTEAVRHARDLASVG